MAIVKFSAALDALACGGRARGIKRLIGARLGISEESPIFRDGPKLSAVIDEIYNDGRSRTIHGTSTKLDHDWSEARMHAESIARLCLHTCIEWVARNPHSDDPRQLST